MAFESQNWSLMSAGSLSSYDGKRLFHYFSSEPLATVIATGYFDPVVEGFSPLRNRDLIYITATSGQGLYYVNHETAPDVTVITLY